MWIKAGKLKLWTLVLSTVGLLGAAAIAYLTFAHSTPNINLENTVLVQSEDLQMQIKANGVVQPVRKINISPKEAGRIMELLVREGDRVQSGQTIARMDDEQLQAQVKLTANSNSYY